ncbi:uncharacterized protein HaLaN_21275 [Haematococcus lacustris]|uniref:Uncharacterized protein n=1 Tax=Haematococcus lacustris TaxID=44745 RepID=A0A699ZY54_HAELA|nr:uncharacterized protein HaLaN_21275 [Haematococcus lacustris]
MDANYFPIIYFNDFWLLRDYLVPMNETVTNVTLHLDLGYISTSWWTLLLQMDQSFSMQRGMGMQAEGEADELKRIFLEGNPILLIYVGVQRVDNFEYEMPSDFEDEEIDEELAFTEEDKKKSMLQAVVGSKAAAAPDGSSGQPSSASKRKAKQADAQATVLTEAYPEAEFNLNPGAASAGTLHCQEIVALQVLQDRL